jgi:hypothetical protein
MHRRLLLLAAILLAVSSPARAGECASKPAVQQEFNSSTPHSLDSPDKKWRIYSIPGHKFSDDASVFLALADTDKKWRIVWLRRRGTAYFSDDSHWLVFRDDYIEEDSTIRAFDLSGSSPKELKHVNLSVRTAMSKGMPKNTMAEYVHFPDFCYTVPAAGTPTSFILLSDTPLLQRPTFWIGYGHHLAKGTPFFLRVEVTLPDAHAQATPYTPTHPPAASDAAPAPPADAAAPAPPPK